jgi:hypothetical protein
MCPSRAGSAACGQAAQVRQEAAKEGALPLLPPPLLPLLPLLLLLLLLWMIAMTMMATTMTTTMTAAPAPLPQAPANVACRGHAWLCDKPSSMQQQRQKVQMLAATTMTATMAAAPAPLPRVPAAAVAAGASGGIGGEGQCRRRGPVPATTSARARSRCASLTAASCQHMSCE